MPPPSRHCEERSDEAISLIVYSVAENFAVKEIATLNRKKNDKSARNDNILRHCEERSDEAISLIVYSVAENFAEMEIATLNSKRNNKFARNDNKIITAYKST